MFLKSYKKIIIRETYSQTIGRRLSLEYMRRDHEGDNQSGFDILLGCITIRIHHHKRKGTIIVTGEEIVMRRGRAGSILDFQRSDQHCIWMTNVDAAVIKRKSIHERLLSLLMMIKKRSLYVGMIIHYDTIDNSTMRFDMLFC